MGVLMGPDSAGQVIRASVISFLPECGRGSRGVRLNTAVWLVAVALFHGSCESKHPVGRGEAA